jgi:hypothetical protein
MFDASFPFNGRWIRIYDKRKVQQQQITINDEIKISSIPSVDPNTIMMTKQENQNTILMKEEADTSGHCQSSQQKSENEDDDMSPGVESNNEDLKGEELDENDGVIVEEIEGEL